MRSFTKFLTEQPNKQTASYSNEFDVPGVTIRRNPYLDAPAPQLPNQSSQRQRATATAARKPRAVADTTSREVGKQRQQMRDAANRLSYPRGTSSTNVPATTSPRPDESVADYNVRIGKKSPEEVTLSPEQLAARQQAVSTSVDIKRKREREQAAGREELANREEIRRAAADTARQQIIDRAAGTQRIRRSRANILKAIGTPGAEVSGKDVLTTSPEDLAGSDNEAAIQSAQRYQMSRSAQIAQRGGSAVSGFVKPGESVADYNVRIRKLRGQPVVGQEGPQRPAVTPEYGPQEPPGSKYYRGGASPSDPTGYIGDAETRLGTERARDEVREPIVGVGDNLEDFIVRNFAPEINYNDKSRAGATAFGYDKEYTTIRGDASRGPRVAVFDDPSASADKIVSRYRPLRGTISGIKVDSKGNLIRGAQRPSDKLADPNISSKRNEIMNSIYRQQMRRSAEVAIGDPVSRLTGRARDAELARRYFDDLSKRDRAVPVFSDSDLLLSFPGVGGVLGAAGAKGAGQAIQKGTKGALQGFAGSTVADQGISFASDTSEVVDKKSRELIDQAQAAAPPDLEMDMEEFAKIAASRQGQTLNTVLNPTVGDSLTQWTPKEIQVVGGPVAATLGKQGAKAALNALISSKTPLGGYLSKKTGIADDVYDGLVEKGIEIVPEVAEQKFNTLSNQQKNKIHEKLAVSRYTLATYNTVSPNELGINETQYKALQKGFKAEIRALEAYRDGKTDSLDVSSLQSYQQFFRPKGTGRGTEQGGRAETLRRSIDPDSPSSVYNRSDVQSNLGFDPFAQGSGRGTDRGGATETARRAIDSRLSLTPTTSVSDMIRNSYGPQQPGTEFGTYGPRVPGRSTDRGGAEEVIRRQLDPESPSSILAKSILASKDKYALPFDPLAKGTGRGTDRGGAKETLRRTVDPRSPSSPNFVPPYQYTPPKVTPEQINREIEYQKDQFRRKFPSYLRTS